MGRALYAVLAAVALVLGTVAPSRAITGNYVPDDEHPYVGLVAFYDANGEFTHRCSGSLLTESIFLTAGPGDQSQERQHRGFQRPDGGQRQGDGRDLLG